jgi:hypothetical protein
MARKTENRDNFRIDRPRPVIVHTGERILNKKQTQYLDKLIKSKKIKLPKGGKAPEKVSITEVKKVYKMLINNTKRNKK